jgi:uncharacterized repeat protein (TIGR01451 family)
MSKIFSKNGGGLLVVGLAVTAFTQALARPPLPAVQVPHGLRGEAAITALGSNLDAVAAHYGKNAEVLRSTLRSDQSLRLDGKANLFYVCEGLALPAVTSSPGNTAVPIYPLSQTFLLHSKPGSTKKIFLDFDGHTISGTAWNADFTGGNNIVAPAWDIDGNPAVFGATEQAIIQQAWFQVAEDYAPFDVDVTTEYPGEAAITRSDPNDQFFGTRALISPISYLIAPNAGGMAYLSVFDDVGDFYKPALIFPENLGNVAKNIAEAVSHEVGHNLGLGHDGTTAGVVYYDGQGNWAPIMGVGYYRPIVQWSKGEYANANNQEDDLAIITDTGLSYRTDDFGGSLATATALNGVNPTTNGIIDHTADGDFFSFQTGSGTARISMTVWELGSDLHARVTIYDSALNVVTNLQSVDDSNGTHNVELTVPVADGKYYVSVAGKGSGDPLTTGYSSYASLGQYVLSIESPPGSGTVVFAPPQPYGTNLSVLNGGDPNGNWYLFVQDDAPLDIGVISNGWVLALTTANLVGTAADVDLSMTASAGTVSAGSDLGYVVSVTNCGPSTSSNVVVADTLPFGVSLVSANVTQGSVTNSGFALSWNVGTLAVNAGAQLAFTVQPAFVGNILNSAVASSATTDPNPDNDTASVGVSVTPPPAVAPQLTGIMTTGAGTIQFSVTNGTSPVIIQASTNLVNWVSIATNTPPFTFSDTTTNGIPYRFYRAVLP